MKIIARGALPAEKVYRVQCNNCKTIFECQQKETKFHPDQRDGSYRTVDCPLCNMQVYVGE